MGDTVAGGSEREECSQSLGDLECRRVRGHNGAHQAGAFEDDGRFGLQTVEWWSIKPNGDPVEDSK